MLNLLRAFLCEIGDVNKKFDCPAEEEYRAAVFYEQAEFSRRASQQHHLAHNSGGR